MGAATGAGVSAEKRTSVKTQDRTPSRPFPATEGLSAPTRGAPRTPRAPGIRNSVYSSNRLNEQNFLFIVTTLCVGLRDATGKRVTERRHTSLTGTVTNGRVSPGSLVVPTGTFLGFCPDTTVETSPH